MAWNLVWGTYRACWYWFFFSLDFWSQIFLDVVLNLSGKYFSWKNCRTVTFSVFSHKTNIDTDFFIDISYLALPQLNLGHSWGNSIIHTASITVFYCSLLYFTILLYFTHHQEPYSGVGSLELEPEPCSLNYQATIPNKFLLHFEYVQIIWNINSPFSGSRIWKSLWYQFLTTHSY